MENTSLQNKTALVTGAARGIGRAIAQRLTAAGATVYVNDLEPVAVEQCVNELRAQGWSAHPAIADVSNSGAVNQLFAKLNKLDILINNAAISRPQQFTATSDADWQAVLSVNLNGTFHCCRAAFPLLAQSQQGRVVNLSSVSAYTGKVLSDNAAYVASKAAIDGLTRSLAREWAEHNITVNSVAPGIVETEIHAQLSAAQRAVLPSLVPSGRLTTAAEIAEKVHYLVSPATASITGQVIHVNGGMYLA
ncbi:MAG: SDR family NAD(P)-dependent oxidoreductase [Blastocatellia bacterium]